MMKTRRKLARPVAVLSLLTILPIASMAGQRPTAAMKYEGCMDHAERQFEICQDGASNLTEFLCWSRFGYDKLGCSVKYAIDSWREA